MQFKTLPALPGNVPSAGCVFGPQQRQFGSKFGDLNFRETKKPVDILARIDRPPLVQVNAGAPPDRNHRLPANGGDAPAPRPGMSRANFGAN